MQNCQIKDYAGGIKKVIFALDQVELPPRPTLKTLNQNTTIQHHMIQRKGRAYMEPLQLIFKDNLSFFCKILVFLIAIGTQCFCSGSPSITKTINVRDIFIACSNHGISCIDCGCICFPGYTGSNCKTEEDLPAFLSAVRNGTYEDVKVLLPSQNHEELDRALVYASGNGEFEIVKLLIDSKADVAPRDTSGRTPLYWASFRGSGTIVKLLLENGANANDKNNDGTPTLLVAALSGDPGVIRLLLDHGAEVDARDRSSQSSLIIASHQGHREAVEILLSKGANVNLVDKRGQTALYLACSEGNVDIVKILLSQGAKVNIFNEEGFTPLAAAAASGKDDLVRYLIKNGAEINYVIDNRFTLLMLPVTCSPKTGQFKM